METYEKVATRIYLIILGISLPIYFLLFAATGHEINVPMEEILWMVVAVAAFCFVLSYHVKRNRKEEIEGIVTGLMIISLLLTLYASAKVFLFVINFDYADDVVLPRIISYVIPVIFILSGVTILIGAIRNKSIP